jgi:hypothetical protein
MVRFQPEAGWIGAFTRHQEPGAIENGKRVVKTASEPGDATPDGTPGVVLGSMREPDGARRYLYFVEWAGSTRVAVACAGNKLRKGDDL